MHDQGDHADWLEPAVAQALDGHLGQGENHDHGEGDPASEPTWGRKRL